MTSVNLSRFTEGVYDRGGNFIFNSIEVQLKKLIDETNQSKEKDAVLKRSLLKVGSWFFGNLKTGSM